MGLGQIMFIEEVRNIKSSKKQLRNFEIMAGIILGLLGGLFYRQQNSCYPYLLVLSAVFLLSGLLLPNLLRPIYKVWMLLALLLGWFTTRVILIVLFYGVVTPIGLLTKLFKKDFLNLKSGHDVDSYWIYRQKTKFTKEDYEKQF